MFTLTEDQENLIENIVKFYKRWNSGVRVGPHPQYTSYSGAAGTGKTTIVKEVIKALDLGIDEYVTCAYVGKAVCQLQKHRLNARTIHSLIYDISMESVEDPSTGKRKMKFVIRLKKELPSHIRIIFVDEATMVNDDMIAEILSFNIPVVFIGDENQLPPVFGTSSVMLYPDFRLKQIMRQSENDPIVILSQMILVNEPLPYGNMGLSSVIQLSNFDSHSLLNYDQVLTTTNRHRYDLNKFIRSELKGIGSNRPQLFDRVICRRNNWQITKNGFALTNGSAGIITDISREYLYKGAYQIDFHPDFLEPGEDFERLLIDANHICATSPPEKNGFFKNEVFEYGYAITVHLSQGSEYDNVVFMDVPLFNREITRKARYTAITRAKSAITVVR